MAKKTNNAISKKVYIWRGAVRFVLAGFLIAVAQPAHAQIVFDPTMYATQLLQKIQTGFAAVTNSAGQLLQTQTSINNTDNINANAKANLEAQHAMKIASDGYLPTSFSSCALNQRARAAAEDDDAGRAVAQALAQGLTNKPATPATNAAEIKADCMFAPTASTDSESQPYKNMGCSSDGTHAHQDRTVEAVLGSLEYRVPPGFKVINGVYQPLTSVPSGTNPDYYKFAAALRFCQHITTPLPPLSQSNTMTADSVMIGPYAAMEAGVSVAPGACFSALEKRMQYGSDVDSSLQARHQTQVDRCTADNKAGFIDDSVNADCQTNGRSELQADRDHAYRLQSTKYTQQVLASYRDTDMMQAAIDRATDAPQAFEQRLVQERAALTQAMLAAAGVGTIGNNSGMAQPVSH